MDPEERGQDRRMSDWQAELRAFSPMAPDEGVAEKAGICSDVEILLYCGLAQIAQIGGLDLTATGGLMMRKKGSR